MKKKKKLQVFFPPLSLVICTIYFAVSFLLFICLFFFSCWTPTTTPRHSTLPPHRECPVPSCVTTDLHVQGCFHS
jgi:hypothetical protein